jgi:soluble lytic murein transglycosylase-like protein
LDLSTINARMQLSAKWAAKYALNPCLVAAVCEQESGWNPFAVRWEPAFFQKYIVPQGLENSTEAHTRAMSFGLMQIMGEVARELGFDGKFLTQLCDPDVSLDFGCRKLKKCFVEHGVAVAPSGALDAEWPLLAYNGGADRTYAEQVLARLPQYENHISGSYGAQGVS